MKTRFNFEKATEFMKKRNFIIAFSVFVLTIFSIGFSYASFFTVKTNTNNQTIETGTLQVSFGNESSAILKNNMQPLSLDEGLSKGDSTVIYIQNTGSLDSVFSLNIGYDMDSFKKRSGYSDSDMLTPIDYIMVAVYEYNGAGAEDTLISGPLSIRELPIYSINETDSRYSRYSLIFGNVGSTTSGNATKTYKIKMWLSDKAIAKASYSYFYVNTEVVAEVKEAKMAYNFNGTLRDGSSALSGAVIDIQNGSLKITTGTDGTFNIPSLYPGTYNVNITYNNEVYMGNLTIAEGSKNAMSSYKTSFTGTDIYKVAYSSGTTVDKIIKKNNLKDYSSEIKLTGGNIYPSYLFTGGNVNDVTMNIKLNTSDKTISFSL